MDGGIWFFLGQVALVVGGYLSLRYKASSENVARLELHVLSLEERVTKLDADHAHCQEEKRSLNDKAIASEAEAARLRIALLEKDSAEKIRLAAEVAQTKQDLKENTEITKSTASAVQGIADKLSSQGT